MLPCNEQTQKYPALKSIQSINKNKAPVFQYMNTAPWTRPHFSDRV